MQKPGWMSFGLGQENRGAQYSSAMWLERKVIMRQAAKQLGGRKLVLDQNLTKKKLIKL